MADKGFLIDLSLFDYDHPVATLEDIRRNNPQRFEMEQLSAVVYVNEADYSCAGYKDVTDKEFWVRGHMPGMPLMPGVLLIEAVAQLAGVVAQSDPTLKPLAGLKLTAVRAAKITGSVGPGTTMSIRVDILGRMGRLVQATGRVKADGSTLLQTEVVLSGD